MVESFLMTLDDKGHALFASKVPKGARAALEATTMACAVTRRLNALGYHDIAVAIQH